MNRRNFFALTLGVATTALIAGCGGGGNDGGGGSSDAGFGRGVVSGAVYLDASGAIVLGDAGAPPAGATPARGAKVEIVDESMRASTGESGGFQLSDVKAGLRTLRVQAGGATRDFPLTVIHGATISFAPTTVSRDQAVASVRSALEVSGDALMVATQQPVPAGVVLSSGDGDVAGVTLPSAQWVVFVDPTPGLLFGHPVKIVCVNVETGSIQVDDREFWPTFNGSHYYLEAAGAAGFADTVQAGRVQPRPKLASASPSPSRAKAHVTRAESAGKLEAILAAGYPNSQFRNDVKQVATIFGNASLPAGVPQIFDPPAASNRDLVFAWEQACNRATSEDTVFFYLSGYGSSKGYALLATNLIAGSGTPPEDLIPTSGATFTYDHLAPKDLTPALLKCLACNVVLMIDTAYAGAWTTFFSTWVNPRKQMNLTVLSSCDATHSGISATAGSFYTTKFVRHILSGSASLPAQSSNISYAHGITLVDFTSSTDKDISSQAPQMFQQVTDPNLECGVAFTPQAITVNPKERTPKKVDVQIDGATPEKNVYSYEFTCTGKQGKIVNEAGSGTKIVSDLPEIRYLPNLGAQIGETDEISVRVMTKESPARLLGTAKCVATVEVLPPAIILSPNVFVLGRGDSVDIEPTMENYLQKNPNTHLEYSWSLPNASWKPSTVITKDGAAFTLSVPLDRSIGVGGPTPLTVEAYEVLGESRTKISSFTTQVRVFGYALTPVKFSGAQRMDFYINGKFYKSLTKSAFANNELTDAMHGDVVKLVIPIAGTPDVPAQILEDIFIVPPSTGSATNVLLARKQSFSSTLQISVTLP